MLTGTGISKGSLFPTPSAFKQQLGLCGFCARALQTLIQVAERLGYLQERAGSGLSTRWIYWLPATQTGSHSLPTDYLSVQEFGELSVVLAAFSQCSLSHWDTTTPKVIDEIGARTNLLLDPTHRAKWYIEHTQSVCAYNPKILKQTCLHTFFHFCLYLESLNSSKLHSLKLDTFFSFLQSNYTIKIENGVFFHFT